jgi:long-subunit fatty acid transport protein
LLPEAARHEFTAGYETRIGKSMNLNLAYQYIRQNRRRGRVYPSQYGNTGIYEFSASLFGATLTYTF